MSFFSEWVLLGLSQSFLDLFDSFLEFSDAFLSSSRMSQLVLNLCDGLIASFYKFTVVHTIVVGVSQCARWLYYVFLQIYVLGVVRSVFYLFDGCLTSGLRCA